MALDARAQQAVPAPPGLPRRASGKALWLRRGVLLAAFAALVGTGAWHSAKPLPPGLRIASAPLPVAPDDLRLLFDVTTADGFGRPVLQHAIFDEKLAMIAAARRFVLLDQFLLNAHGGATDPASTSGNPLRPLSRELTEALVAARRARPELRVLLITDPVNDVYGGQPSADLDRLAAAGVEVVRTDLDRLRDPNPAYSAFWRLAIRWWSGDGRGAGWLPNPLAEGPSRVTFRAWARLLNFKANHRKVLIADDGAGGLVGLVGSSNPHDASSAHSNAALQLRGDMLRALIDSEQQVARFSGWRGEALPLPPAAPAAPGPGAAAATVRVLTEGAILDALLEQLAATGTGDRVDVAMFYLAERNVIDALLAAAARGAQVRVLLDPNKDAFGRVRSGIPNRPVAAELVARSDGAIRVRWYRTHGEQFHAKLVAITRGGRTWLTTGSANLTRRNVGDFNLEANVAVELPSGSAPARDAATWFDTLWNNLAPAGIEYTADFGTYADPAQSRYWAFRIMEATGLSTF
jgi:phosphatidylserine/phosphatidylglycerophosphate/cardiolipin synthase-like enzyme